MLSFFAMPPLLRPIFVVIDVLSIALAFVSVNTGATKCNTIARLQSI